MTPPIISVVLEVKTTPVDFNLFLIFGPGEGAAFVHKWERVDETISFCLDQSDS